MKRAHDNARRPGTRIRIPEPLRQPASLAGRGAAPAISLAQVNDLISTLEDFKPCLTAVEQCARVLIQCLRNGGKILSCGNGGSAADALHLAEELVGKFCQPRRSLPAICLAADPTLMTCIGNDFGFDQVFARQIEGLGQPGDVLVVFTTSGNSQNLLNALEAARRRKLTTIALLGKGGGKALGLADHEVLVPSEQTARVQEVQTLILHLWLECVEREL